MDEQQPKRRRGRPPTPIPEIKRLRGRPRYAPAREQKAIAERLLAVGESHEDIARLLGISEPTFRLRFAAQIVDARLRKRSEFLQVVFEKALAGNAVMLKLAMDLTSVPEPGSVPYTVPGTKPEAQEKPTKLGKKEQQALEAANPDLATPMGELMARRQRGERVQ